MDHDHGGSLDFNDCYFVWLHGTLMAQVVHCLTKMAITLPQVLDFTNFISMESLFNFPYNEKSKS